MISVDNIKPKQIRVIIADDNREMRDAIVKLLESTYDFEIVDAVGDGRALVESVLKLEPEIGVIDISMPIMNGILAAAEIKRLGSEMKIVFLTVNEDCDFVWAAFENGATGYVVKRQMASDLEFALKEAIAGRTFVSTGCELATDA